MEKIAIVEISEIGTKLSVFECEGGKSRILKEFVDKFSIGEEIFKDQLLKPVTVNSIIEVLIVYREIIQKFDVKKFICISSNLLLKARNQKGFFEEIYNNTGFVCLSMNEEEAIKNLFLSVNNSIDIAKGNCIYIGQSNTYFLKYNRRTSLSCMSLPFGSRNLDFEEKSFDEIVEIVKNEIKSKKNFAIDSVENVVGCGNAFIDLGRVAKKIERYPLDIDNNYVVSKETVLKSLNFIKGLDLEKVSKIKGMTEKQTTVFLAGQAIIQAIFESFKISELIFSTANLVEGVLLNLTAVDSQVKFNDLLAESFDEYNFFRGNCFSNNVQTSNLAIMLFKQFKVLHKLSRNYIKVARIAGYLFDSGKTVNDKDFEKYSHQATLFSGIKGVSHRDLLLASFVCMNQNPDNFALAEWMKYKDLLEEEDLNAVRKLGVILQLSIKLSTSLKANISDIVCEVLGDAVIMKAISLGDVRYNVRQGLSVSDEFRKVFKKNLQVI